MAPGPVVKLELHHRDSLPNCKTGRVLGWLRRREISSVGYVEYSVLQILSRSNVRMRWDAM